MNGRFGSPGRGDEAARPQLPLLDRLIDDAPEVARDPPLSPAEAVALLRRGLRRDVEALLNARRRWRSWPAGYGELALSPIGFGIGDFAAGAFNDRAERERLRRRVEDTVRRFEPRLARVRVVLLDPDNTLDPTLRLRIEAMLLVDPAPEPVAFDTLIDPVTAEVQVKPNAARAAPDV